MPLTNYTYRGKLIIVKNIKLKIFYFKHRKWCKNNTLNHQTLNIVKKLYINSNNINYLNIFYLVNRSLFIFKYTIFNLEIESKDMKHLS